MQALRIHRRLESETVPELRPLIGRVVEIIVLEDSQAVASLPNAPASEQDWQDFFAAAGTDLIDPEIVLQYREFNRQHHTPPPI